MSKVTIFDYANSEFKIKVTDGCLEIEADGLDIHCKKMNLDGVHDEFHSMNECKQVHN